MKTVIRLTFLKLIISVTKLWHFTFLWLSNRSARTYVFTYNSSYPKVFLKRPETCNFIKKETLAHVFFFEICKIFKNSFFIEHLFSGGCFFYSNNQGLKRNRREILLQTLRPTFLLEVVLSAL